MNDHPILDGLEWLDRGVAHEQHSPARTRRQTGGCPATKSERRTIRQTGETENFASTVSQRFSPCPLQQHSRNSRTNTILCSRQWPLRPQSFQEMAFSNQFSLSLELTRLLPLGPAINLFGGAMTKLARELTAYGSDIVVEEDLAAFFGRLKTCQHFEKTFRMAVGVTVSPRGLHSPQYSILSWKADQAPQYDGHSPPNPRTTAIYQLSSSFLSCQTFISSTF